MRKFKALVVAGIIIGIALLAVNQAFADEYDELQEKKEEKLQEKSALQEEVKTAEIEKKDLGTNLDYYKGELIATQGSLAQKEKFIAQIDQAKKNREAELEAKTLEKNILMRDLYKKTDVTPLELIVGSDSYSSLAQAWYYYQQLVNEGKRQVLEVAFVLSQMQDELARQESLRAKLAKDASVLSSQTIYFDNKIQETSGKISGLSGDIDSLDEDIADITARQQELIAEKLSATSASLTVGEYETARSSLPDPGFSPAFAVFSYGRPHRVAMSQYGAFGRAKAGQSYDEILNAYYEGIEIVEYEGPEEITVTGNFNETIAFEDNYMKGIAEMPTSWGEEGGMEALKAQAIAARTYALSYTHNGEGSICDSQSCQVYLPSKAESDAAALWHEAVEATRGLVMTYDGSPIKAWYASTHGCYSRLPTDFDVAWNSTPSYIKRVRDTDEAGRCFEGPEYADSPWYHKAWYGGSDGHPWLTGEEMADLFNASLLPNSYNEHLSHPDNDGWSHEEVRSALQDTGITPISSVRSVESVFSGEGYTATLRVSHGGGTTEIDAQRFRKIFVLRSRGHLALWSSLFDIVTR